ncbi:hypothetical protein MCOR25_002964 [Pyricularia grisea]|uniref:Cytochrome P450 n=1 Tax=Pyricularia grisea TaxID=148305 RepID=A0A6P8AVK8_PYRGI|nr:uncharacterized protein PgNI_08770 [Pyricularia grisea]KAI6375397.1 hypothetical protein MCOR25_002964 [Pyricularia grisea]TLD06261.1 hypothetical protein PgNI_08770 [Pyricularia grisea]
MAGENLSLEILDRISVGRVLAGIFLFIVTSFIVDILQQPSYPKSLPRVGYGSGPIATVKNWLGYVFKFPQWVDSGYQKYSKAGKAFVVPSAASRPQEIVVPRTQTAWMLDLPERQLSSAHAQSDVLYSEYQFLGSEFATDSFHINIIHRNLTRHLSTLIPSLQDEVQVAVDETFGTDTENWKEFNLWESWVKLVPSVINRVLVGPELCRNKELLHSMVHFADTVVMNSFVLSLFPKTLQPIIGRALAIRNWRLYRKAHKILEPAINQRLEMTARKEAGKDAKMADWEPSEDFITWTIRMARNEGRSEELNSVHITKRLLPIEFAAIHTTVITGHFLLIDLLTSDPKKGFMDSIREEASSVLQRAGGRWTKDDLWNLYRADSAIRESQRLSIFATSLTKRKVVAPEGITNPVEGWHVPQGGYLMLNLDGPQHDEDLYENSKEYDALRFSRPREEYDARPADKKDLEEYMQLKKLGMVTTSDTHLAFGHGRHACPGRFFVAHMLKMTLAHLLCNYEFEPLPEKPKAPWMGQLIIPPVDVKIRLRRRKGTA